MRQNEMVSILIPTYNAGSRLHSLLDSLTRQQLRLYEIIIVDSSSTDDTVIMANSFGAQTYVIPKHDFDHGGTRTLLGSLAKGDVLVYLTQDALPLDETSVPTLVSRMLVDKRNGAVFGRQIPHCDATPFARHLRQFNYPTQSHTRAMQDRVRYGMKTAFCSNSFAAYRREALESVGWFKKGLLMGEDMHACAKMLKQGYHVAYAADAVVYHSHNYSLRQELKRYFDLGVFLNKEYWILDELGKPEGEGLRFIRSELSYLIKTGYLRYVPLSVLRAAVKGLGYRLGHLYRYLPRWAIQRLSMHST